MKKLTLLLIMLLTFVGYTQESFTYDERGLTPKYLVEEFEGISQQELFDRTIYWINDTYKNPDEVIKATISNKKIRFEGVSMDRFSHTLLGTAHYYNATYTIEVSFKQNKYKFELIKITYRIPGSQYGNGYIVKINLDNGEGYYRKNGKLKGKTKNVPKQLENLINGLQKSLKIFVKGYKEINNDW